MENIGYREGNRADITLARPKKRATWVAGETSSRCRMRKADADVGGLGGRVVRNGLDGGFLREAETSYRAALKATVSQEPI